ncbi:MAG: hypothetical protein M0C28_31085 [Candidatus Moduliflexus flocculans]|nr:hypothetical protein [Candidatus Moduliflexus flocculans]
MPAAAATGACAQGTESAADHDTLRKLKSDLEQAVSKRDFDAVKNLFHQPFMATVVTQEQLHRPGDDEEATTTACSHAASCA